MSTNNLAVEERVLILAPSKYEAQITQSLLSDVKLNSFVCDDMDRLLEEVSKGAGVIVLTEEAFMHGRSEIFEKTLREQPPWSELPVVLLAYDGETLSGIVERVPGIVMLERPVILRTLQSSIHAAVRARMRQYEIREQLVERERLLESERAARSEAERASRMKDEFLATLSHELRTPLNAMLGWTQLLMRGGKLAKESDVIRGLEIINRNARTQAQLIEDLLDMSRIISGKLRLTIEKFQPLEMIKASIDSVHHAAAAKNISIVTNFGSHETEILGDQSRLQQVVWNLISNAIKFTPQDGKIQISLIELESYIEIEVRDNGKGMEKEFLPYVFDKFRQAEGAITRSYGGLGLGLAIVRNLVELHGGTVNVSSDGIGKGSAFTVRLPQRKLDEVLELSSQEITLLKEATVQQKSRIDDCSSIKGSYVLVVDDEEDSRSFIVRLLEECNVIVYAAASAEEAIKLLGHHSFHAIVSDIGMPKVDGYEFIKQVRKLPNIKTRNIPAIALTAFARSEDAARSLEAGYQLHISKPVENAQLLTALASLVSVHELGLL